MAQFPWFSWVALKIELAKCFVFSMWQQNQTNFFPLYVSVQMIKLQWVCSRNFERRRGQDEHRLKIMNYMYCMFIKRTIPGGVNKKIVINNGNIITYKMLYIPVGMLLTVYLETFVPWNVELPSQSRFQLQLYQFLLPFDLHQSYYIFSVWEGLLKVITDSTASLLAWDIAA